MRKTRIDLIAVGLALLLLAPGRGAAQTSEIREGWVSPAFVIPAPEGTAAKPRMIEPVLDQGPSWGWYGAVVGVLAGLGLAAMTYENVDGCIGCGVEFVAFPILGAVGLGLAGHGIWILAGRP